MPAFLRNFAFDQVSFWIGFVTSIILLWFLDKNRPFLNQIWARIQDLTSRTRQNLSAGTEQRYRTDLLRSAQQNHLTAAMFPLDEILIEPHILAPPAHTSPGKDNYPSEVAAAIIPYLPDWPELASNYAAPTLNLTQCLEGGANLILLGRAGAGKSVALAHLASQLSRQAPQLGDLSDHLPILVHIADLNLQTDGSVDPAELLIHAVSAKASALTQPRLPSLLRQSLQSGKILLLLDGVDELPPKQVDQVVKYLHALLKSHRKIRIIVAASPHYYDGLTKLGLIPVAMASWSRNQREWFLQNWSDLWHRFIIPENPEMDERIDPLMLTGWLLQENATLTPLEFTLKVWAAFAGDVLGAGANEALESFARRMTQNNHKFRSALEYLALSSTTSMQPMIPLNNLKELVSELDASMSSGSQAGQQKKSADDESAAITKGITDLIETGLLVEHANGVLTFCHPTIAGFLAAKRLSLHKNGNPLINQPEWTGKSTTFQLLVAEADVTALVSSYLNKEADPLFRGPLTVARWLRDTPKEAPWRTQVMRTLANLLQDDTLPRGLRTRAITALSFSNEPGVSTLVKRLIASNDDTVRLMGVLGSGLCSDAQSVNELQNLLADPTPAIRQAACLALVAIGNIPALEAVASALLHGEEDVRKAASEALAHHPEEGHPILQDGAAVDDLLVRRGVIHGLVKVRQPWAIQILEKMQVEDGQWVVRNAATQALEELSSQNSLIPQPRPVLSETPWLIAFAGEQGIGISPGKPAENLLVNALQTGNQDQRIAALDRLALIAAPDAIPAIYQALFNSGDEVREAAYNALWHMAAAGVDLPPPPEIPN
ncbi:MAG TPA: HEAT repeat domain-containing protein [Anaerolineales bacterium]